MMKKTIFYKTTDDLPIIKNGFVSPGIIFGKYHNIKWVEHIENDVIKSVYFYRNGQVHQYNKV